MKQPVNVTNWWQAVDRRTFGKGVVAFATLLSMSGCGSEEELNGDTLTLQQQHGWNVGAKDRRLVFSGKPMQRDAAGSGDWQVYTDPARLISAWQPRQAVWQPFFVPTLIQALREESLRSQIRPIMSPRMQEAFRRGQTLQQDLLSQVTNGSETFFIADLPGPEAVAFGAGMASGVDLMLAFDNWPHPHGVVRSHDTLAALLTFAGAVQKQRESLPDGAPGLLLLDSDRLAPYVDESTQFDNRFLASAPGAAELQQRGVKQVMYITPNRGRRNESDDLNALFVEYQTAQMGVEIFPLTDLVPVTETVERTEPGGTTQAVREKHYYYGGGLSSHLGFFLLYSFLLPRPMLYYPMYAGGGFAGRGVARGDLRRPAGVRRPNYQARPRPTMFSGRGVGGQRGVGRRKPSGFGRTTVRSSGGRVTGLGSRSRMGRRSGSFGRGRGFSL
jgi:hypothetical protein